MVEQDRRQDQVVMESQQGCARAGNDGSVAEMAGLVNGGGPAEVVGDGN